MEERVTVIGGGLAGCEAALQLGLRGVSVRLVEMRPSVQTTVHEGDGLAELVCSNSLKSLDATSAAGALKSELAIWGSVLLSLAFESRVAAGGALAVDRTRFSQLVEEKVSACPAIEVVREEVTSLEPWLVSGERCIVAAGPLCSDALAADIARVLGDGGLAFFDAAAPIVEADSLDMDVLFAQSRHGRGGSADYLNAPFDKESYEAFVDALVNAKRVIEHDFKHGDLFSACQPVEEIARSGVDALRYGAFKPIGLVDPRTGHRPWAAIQLRAENAEATAYNLVGFQTNLTFGEQDRIIHMIPGLENAVVARHGVMHRNTFIDSPHVLDPGMTVPGHGNIRFAGQICGTEGYLEAVACGLFAALGTYADITGVPDVELPRETFFGALLAYASDKDVRDYQPMHVNMGIMPPLDPPVKRKRERYTAHAERARSAAGDFVDRRPDLAFLTWEGPDMQRVAEEVARSKDEGRGGRA